MTERFWMNGGRFENVWLFPQCGNGSLHAGPCTDLVDQDPYDSVNRKEARKRRRLAGPRPNKRPLIAMRNTNATARASRCCLVSPNWIRIMKEFASEKGSIDCRRFLTNYVS